jgi:hypothetical protein
MQSASRGIVPASRCKAALIQEARAMSDHAFFDQIFHTTKLARPLGVKGLGRFQPYGKSQVKISSLLHNELARPLGVKRP